jgi:diguanylate cyclase (GGDEF)-like protein/PAS domain S-box-containing protein
MRLRLASLSEGFIHSFSRTLFKGIDEAARSIDADHIVITCGPLASSHPEMKMRNILYEHIDASLYDGFIIPYSSMSQYSGRERFLEKISSVIEKPCVTIGGKIPGHPCIVPDWENGMILLIEHLVEIHSCRRFLFIRGLLDHQMSNARESGFRKGLAGHGIPESCLEIIHADFRETNRIAETIVREKKIENFDAIIFVSDESANEAIGIFSRGGYRVPADIIVCACTNAPSGRQMSPITTLDEEIQSTGTDAVRMLKRHMEGEIGDETYFRPVALLVRESCGCTGWKPKLESSDESLAILEYFQLFRQLGFSLISDNHVGEIFPLLNKELGTEYCSVSLFQKGEFPFRESRAVATYSEEIVFYHGMEGPLFKTEKYFPDEVLSSGRKTLLIEPLYYKDTHLGMFCMDCRNHNGLIYEVILSQFASALHMSLQHSRLIDAEKRFFDMAFASSDWLWETDETGKILYSSEASSEMPGTKSETLEGADFFSCLLPQDTGQLDTLKKRMFVSRTVIRNQEVMSKNRNGTPIFFLLSGKPVFSESGAFKGYRGACKDITHTKKAEERIRFMAYNDALTKLPNRRLFIDRLETEFKNAKRERRSFSLMFADLDNFKAVNDSLGHEKGDQLLISVAECFSRCIRVSDTLARVGGDEFVFLLPLVQSESSAEIVADRILDAFTERFARDPEYGAVGASIGIAMYPADGDNIDTLLRNADTAMYQAKSKGKGNYQFYSKETPEPLKTGSRQKLRREGLLLPVYSISDNKIIGFRAGIVRRGAENNATMIFRNGAMKDEIEEMHEEEIYLSQLAGMIALWNKRYDKNLFFIHPVSPRTLATTEMFSAFTEILASLNTDPVSHYLSVTPEVPASDQGHFVQALSFLNEQNYPLMISGCSTTGVPLDLIEKVKFSSIGFAASDADKARKSRRYASLMQMIMNVAENQGMSLFAEGAETEEQIGYFRQLGFAAYMNAWAEHSIEGADAERLLIRG